MNNNTAHIVIVKFSDFTLTQIVALNISIVFVVLVVLDKLVYPLIKSVVQRRRIYRLKEREQYRRAEGLDIPNSSSVIDLTNRDDGEEQHITGIQCNQ